MNNNSCTKDDSAINQHNQNTTKNKYFQDFATYTSNGIRKTKTYSIKNHRYTDDH